MRKSLLIALACYLSVSPFSPLGLQDALAQNSAKAAPKNTSKAKANAAAKADASDCKKEVEPEEGCKIVRKKPAQKNSTGQK